MTPKLLLIDGHSLLHRGFYGLPLLTNQEGEYTNAVYGFLNIFLKLYDEESPDYVIVAFDVHHPTFRHEAYTAYKGTRKPMPEELRPQVPLLKQVLAKMRIKTVECPGFEADDILGTLAVQAEARGIVPVIVTGDRDLLQLAGEKTKIRIPKTKMGKTEVEDYLAADVLEKMGVTPRAYIDVKALMGDTSDNIPGVPGIGEVTATKIIAEYGSVENAIAHAEAVKPKKASENLRQYSEQALLSKRLATIVLDAPVTLDENEAAAQSMWNEDVHAEFIRLEFKSLLARFKKEDIKKAGVSTAYRVLETQAEVTPYMQNISRAGTDAVSFYLLAHEADFAGMGIGVLNEAPVFIPVTSIAGCKDWFESPAPKITHDAKSAAAILYKQGIILNGVIFDEMLAGYLLDALKPSPGLSDIAPDYLNENFTTLDELLDNKGKKTTNRKSITDLSAAALSGCACRAAEILGRAYPLMRQKLTDNEQLSLFQDIELPLAGVLREMEQAGVKVDPATLTQYGETLEQHIRQLTAEIYALAGQEFNIQSPAQLGDILFGKLGLKGTKKTTQGFSTAADVLEKLAAKHPIVPLILEYRTYAKLKSTYVDSLLNLIDPETSRIHSTFHQALTATGRLSSADPNLQNIPIREALGRQLRKAFIPPEGCVFIDADYSQIELRVLAHMSGDETLIDAFINGADIHRLTASQVFHTAPEYVTPEQRSSAKAVNFGIVYGISAFGLSEDLHIPKKEAERYIQGYFEKYPRVKLYLDDSVEYAKFEGFAKTLYNRRRAMPELASSNFNQRSFGERVAMNMPIQGSAADIIKIAMVKVSQRLKREKLKSRLVLQVHDELLLEAEISEAEAVKALVKEEMERAAALAVPLVADVHEGGTWYDAK